jgi:hypothetical protein
MGVQRERKTVHSIRLSPEGIVQLKNLSRKMGRSEGNVIEIALDRMFREEVRFGHLSAPGLDSPVQKDDH